MKKIVYAEEPCTRCASKRFIARVWMEKIPTYSGGFTEVEYSQIKCTNDECQKEFEARLKEETQKKEAIRVQREKNEVVRKAAALQSAQKAHASKSRI